jgi:uncharacterized membrane-anchored protein
MLVVAWRVTQVLLRRFLDVDPSDRSLATKTKTTAVAALVLWVAVIIAGKFLAYTNTELLVYG